MYAIILQLWASRFISLRTILGQSSNQNVFSWGLKGLMVTGTIKHSKVWVHYVCLRNCQKRTWSEFSSLLNIVILYFHICNGLEQSTCPSQGVNISTMIFDHLSIPPAWGQAVNFFNLVYSPLHLTYNLEGNTFQLLEIFTISNFISEDKVIL